MTAGKLASQPRMVQPMPLDRTRIQTLASQMTERESWSREHLLEYQQQSLDRVLQHAVKESPYYRRVLGDAIREGARFHELPILTKSQLMDCFDEVKTQPHLRLDEVERHLASDEAAKPLLGQYYAAASGGTTGERGVIVYDRAAWEVMVANVLRWLRAMSVAPNTRVAAIGSPAPIHLTNRLFPEIQAGRSGAPRLSVLTPVKEIVAALNAYQPELVITYSSMVRILAQEQLAGRLRIAPASVAGGTETLTQDVRDLASQAWEVRTRDMYGTTETGLLGVDCEHESKIHLADDLVVCEVVDEHNRPVAPGVAGEKILVTTMFNRLLPLIRYEISDVAAIALKNCPCGRPWTRLDRLEGRREDFLTLPARLGGVVRVHGLRVRQPLLQMPGVRQVQVVVIPEGLLVKVVLRDEGSSQATLGQVHDALRRELEKLGASLQVLQLEAVPEIERAGTGAKEKLVVHSRGQP